MPGRRLVTLTFGAVVAASVLLLGGVLSGQPRANPLAVLAANARVSPEQAELGRLFAGFSSGHSARVVRTLEQRVERSPGDGDVLAVLALAYQQRARETGDPAYYALSGTAL